MTTPAHYAAKHFISKTASIRGHGANAQEARANLEQQLVNLFEFSAEDGATFAKNAVVEFVPITY